MLTQNTLLGLSSSRESMPQLINYISSQFLVIACIEMCEAGSGESVKKSRSKARDVRNVIR